VKLRKNYLNNIKEAKFEDIESEILQWSKQLIRVNNCFWIISSSYLAIWLFKKDDRHNQVVEKKLH
jgi:hypothetical protein